MEMTKVDENIQTAQNMLSGIVERCYELEEENKKLKEDVDYRHHRAMVAERGGEDEDYSDFYIIYH